LKLTEKNETDASIISNFLLMIKKNACNEQEVLRKTTIFANFCMKKKFTNFKKLTHLRKEKINFA